MADVIYLVIPCYNEEEALPLTSIKLKEKLQFLINAGLAAPGSRILFVDDGSKDRTWEEIELFCNSDKIYSGLKLSRNKGHQNALLAGLMAAKEYAGAVISMDADLQDDINVMDKFLMEYYSGCDVVYGVRSCRDKDNFFKRGTAECFYKFMLAIGVDIVPDHADYRLLSKRALECLSDFREVNLFLRGLIPLIGFKSAVVEYQRGERVYGKSKYPLKKMIALAIDGITSFSVKPIRLVTIMGLAVSVLSIMAFLICAVAKLTGLISSSNNFACSVWFLGGIQLLSLGVIGEYVGKIYIEVKDRPKYFIEKHIK